MKELKEIISSTSGFKIPNTHFKIGSKIHISDFYYAKRFFQNGFFSSRIAFLLVKDIIEKVKQENLLEDIKQNGLTIVGYEMYSELLISFVEKFLKKSWGLTKSLINHNLYQDGKDLFLCKTENFNKNIIIVVPIASTFSTAIKIENRIISYFEEINLKEQTKPREINILQPLYNILYVSDGIQNEIITDLENQFGWTEKSISNKTITLSVFNNLGVFKLQKYYIPLATSWHDVDNCIYCNPYIENYGNSEKPLYETDQTNVTPAIVFNLPKGRNIDDLDLKRSFKLDNDAINYGHHIRNNAHFLFSINTEYFLQINFDSIQNWLLNIKNSEEFKKSCNDLSKVLIISTCHFSNTAFINLVNDILFLGSANIIHFEPKNDYIQNFELIYSTEINDADKIYFVDDSLKSGNTFDKLYQFVENSFNRTNQKNKLDGCIFLINKSQPYIYNSIKNRLNTNGLFISFANMHLYTALKATEVAPLVLEKNRYELLYNDSNIDVIKNHFYYKALKLNDSYSADNYNVENKIKSSRHRELLISTHRVFEYFTKIDNPKLNSFYDFINDINVKIGNQIEHYKIENNIDSINSSDGAKAYLKVLTQLPFVQYKPLNDRVFEWVIDLLKDHIKSIIKSINSEKFVYTEFETLKFLIRRAALVNTNYIISKDFTDFLSVLYGENGIPYLLSVPNSSNELLQIITTEDDKVKLNQFYIFYIAQIKELLQKNEYRSLEVEKRIVELANSKIKQLNQISRILKEENTILINDFYIHISSLKEWNKIFFTDRKKKIVFENNPISTYLEKINIKSNPKYLGLESYFKSSIQNNIIENHSFLNFLWLKYFLDTDKYDKKLDLNEKTNLIFKKLFELFSTFNVFELGSFFVVLDSDKKRESHFVAFNQNNKGFASIDIINELQELDSEISLFLNNNDRQKFRKTIIEYGKQNDNSWKDLYQTENNEGKIHLKLDTYNRLLLIQISKPNKALQINLSNQKDIFKPQALIGFYYNLEQEKCLDTNLIQYLLLLREPLSKFISNHHENDEFRDWQIANIKQKTSLLTGHGRDMLMSIVSKFPDKYEKIIQQLLLIQRFVIDQKEEKRFTQDNNVFDNYKEKFSNIIKENSQTINQQYIIDTLKPLAIDIFNLQQVENTVQLNDEDIEVTFTGTDFKFDIELLKMICFEIFVNAKKNRWLFIDKEEITAEDITYTANKIWINANCTNSEIKLKITNTGPISDFDESILNNIPIKNSDSTSGIELIRTFITDFRIGKIQFLSSDTIKDDFGKISVLLTLNNSFSN